MLRDFDLIAAIRNTDDVPIDLQKFRLNQELIRNSFPSSIQETDDKLVAVYEAAKEVRRIRDLSQESVGNLRLAEKQLRNAYLDAEIHNKMMLEGMTSIVLNVLGPRVDDLEQTLSEHLENH